MLWRILKYLDSENFVLASESNLSLATGLASWRKVSLKPWPGFCKTCLVLWYYLQISSVAMQLHVRMRPVKSAPFTRLPKILLSWAHQSKTYSVVRDISHSPVALPGWPHSWNVPIYDAHMHIYNTERLLRKSLPTWWTWKGTSMLVPLPRMAYSLLSVMDLLLLPVNALLFTCRC